MKLFAYLIALSFFVFLYVPPANAQVAESNNVIIMQLQTGGIGASAASQEFVLLFNFSDEDVVMSNWCIEYSSGNDNVGFKSCINTSDSSYDLLLKAKGFMSFSTSAFVAVNTDFTPDVIFSGGMSPTNGHLRLIDENDTEQDKVGWGNAINPEGFAATAHEPGFVLSRDFETLLPDTNNNLVDFTQGSIKGTISSDLYEREIIIDLCNNIDEVQTVFPEGMLSDETGACYVDFCPNIEELQIEAPLGYQKVEGSNTCTIVPLENAVLFITEMFPNAPSTDTGQEFIELFNPNNRTIQLKGYKIKVGPGYTKEFIFADGQIRQEEYLIFSDLVTGIVLPNTNGVQLRLISPAGTTVSETGVYSNADEDESWALVEDQWIFTNQITPGAANKPFLVPAVNEVAGVTSVLAPCSAGKYRSPETNRCRNIETAVSLLSPCDEDEFRNPETNRCNKVSSTSTALTPCKVGQVRNPETNRCRAATSSTELQPCDEGEERNPETNRCRKLAILGSSDIDTSGVINDVKVASTEGSVNFLAIFATISATVGYILYEWRSELQRKLYLFKKA